MNNEKIIKYIFILLTTGLLFITNSCCTKKYCPDNWFWIEFNNYSNDDLDTVFFCRYAKNTNYSALVDSVKQDVFKSNGSDNHSLPLEKIEADFDYKIYILSLGKVHTLSDIQTKKEACNSCFLLIPSDKYIQIKSFRLDGQTNTGRRAEIFK